jgi:hypothetical protein
VRVGTGEGASGKIEDDPHPEYVADELLVLTQGRDVVDDHGKPTTLTDREPGRFGEPGWTKEAGMPFWEGSGPREAEEDSDKGAKDRKTDRSSEKAEKRKG